MKTRRLKLLSVLLTLAMLGCCIPYLAISATETAVSKFTEASFYSVDSYVVGGSERGACYVIDLKTDQTIYLSSGSGYWDRNLQQNGGGCSEEHKARADVLRKSIRINGTTVDADLTAGTDHTNSTMISTVEPNILRLHIRKAENHYGLTDTGDFTLEIDAGITINGFPLCQATIRYTASTGSFSIENGEAELPQEDFTADITETELLELDTPCPNDHGGAQWAVQLGFDKDIFPTDGVANYYRNHLSVGAAACSDGKTTVGADLRKAILINGKNLSACIAEDGTNEYTAVHVQTVRVGNKSYLRIVIPKTNKFGFSGERFTITLKQGITLNGYTLKPKTITYTQTAAGGFTLGSLEGGTVSPDGATAQKAVFQVKTGTYCSNHTEVASDHWLVNIYFDRSIRQNFASSESYWNRHLHAAADTKEAICRNILLNGKTLAECIEIESRTTHDGEASPRNAFNALHIQNAGSNGEVLQIAIPSDNLFGVDAMQAFTVTVKNGITLGGHALNPLVASYAAAATGTFQVTDYTESEEPEDGMRPILVKLSESASGFCTSHGDEGKAIAQWIVDLYFEEPVYDSSISPGYYRRHLQQKGWSSENTSGAETLSEAILLNGKTLIKCYELSTNRTDYAQYVHLQANEETKPIFRIAIPKDNTYGFDGTTDFEIVLKKGIKLNGHELAASRVKYTAADGAFTVEKYSDTVEYPDPDAAHVTTARLATAGSQFCTSHDAGEEWLIDLFMDKAICPGNDDVASFYRRHLAVNEASSATGKTTVGGVVRKAILLNGKSLNVCMGESGTNAYMAHHVQLLENSSGEHYLRIAVPKNNLYGFAGTADFEITLKKGLVFNGFEVSPRKITYRAATGQFEIEIIEDSGIESGVLHVVRTAVDEKGSGIMIWPSGDSKYIDIILDDYLTGTSKNSEALPTAHGESCRNFILVDGMTVSEWINYGAGDLYQVMVRFENNYIRLLLDGSREPGMSVDEYHWIEFREGLISSTGEKIAPAKLYYDPNTTQWTIVDSFEGLEKPWWITNYEEKTDMATGGQPGDPTYQRPQTDWEEGLLEETPETEPTVPSDEDTDSELVEETEPEDDEKTESDGKKQVSVTVRKPVPKKTVYETYFPVWAIVLIAVGGAAAVAAVVGLVIVRRKKAKTAETNG